MNLTPLQISMEPPKKGVPSKDDGFLGSTLTCRRLKLGCPNSESESVIPFSPQKQWKTTIPSSISWHKGLRIDFEQPSHKKACIPHWVVTSGPFGREMEKPEPTKNESCYVFPKGMPSSRKNRVQPPWPPRLEGGSGFGSSPFHLRAV